MERNYRKTENINEDKEKNKNLSLKAIKKPKGYCRFLRNVIKEKAQVMKDVIQKRFFKWRKDALKGKLKKTVMIRISVSKEKEPKSHYQLNKAYPKEQSKSVNKNDLKSFNINNVAKNITNLKIQNIDKIDMQDKRINDNKNKNVNQNKNIVNRNIVDIKNKKEPEKRKELINNKAKPDIQNKTNDKGKINNKIEIPKVVPKNDKINKVNTPNIQKPNQNIVIKNPQAPNIPKPNQNIVIKNPQEPKIPKPNQNIVIKNSPNVVKPNITNNNNIILYTYNPPSKRNNTKPVKNIRDNKNLLDKNYMNKIIQSDTKDKKSKDYYKKYEKYNQHTSLPVKKVEIDLTDGKYKRKTFNRENKDIILKNNLSLDKNRLQNKNIYNTNSYQRRNNNNNDNKSSYSYGFKTENYNDSSSSINTLSRKESNFSYVTTPMRNSTKGGITTVIQHYSGQRRELDNYDNNTLEANKNKK